MRSYLIDEILPGDLVRLRDRLKAEARPSQLDQIFWVPLPEPLLEKTQAEHLECRPHVFAVEFGRDWIKLEFFVRSAKTLRCTCPAPASVAQREFILGYADRLLETLRIRT